MDDACRLDLLARPGRRLILTFADQEAADSLTGWRAVWLKRRGIEARTVPLPDAERDIIRVAQKRQRR